MQHEKGCNHMITIINQNKNKIIQLWKKGKKNGLQQYEISTMKN